jgi:Flp pilus assembly protein TadD
MTSARSRPLLLATFLPLLLGGCATLRGDAQSVGRDLRALLAGTARGGGAEEPERIAKKLLEGDYHARQGELQRALLAYFEAAQLEPEAIGPRLRIAHLQIRADPKRAERSFDALVAEEPESAAGWFGLGLARLARSELEGARAALERAVALEPGSTGARSALASVLDRLGEHVLARAELEAALEIDPDAAFLLNNLAVSHLLTGDAERAEELLRSAAALNPQDPAIYNDLGLSLGLQRRYEEALAMFRRAGDERSAQNNLALLYQLNGQPAEAVAAYERALLADGEHAVTVLENLRRAQEALERGARDAR